MSRSPKRMLRRAAAVLLLASTAARVAAPGVDALRFHTGAPASAPVPHVDRFGGCGSHAERCGLAAPASAARLTTDRRVPELADGVLATRDALPSGERAPRRGPTSPHASRPPPLRLRLTVR
jgi:hypothetical protein